VLAHEAIPIEQNNQGRIRRSISASQRDVLEAAAALEQLEYFDIPRRVIPGSNVENDSEIRRVREQVRRHLKG
jgi:hypothetical protein